MAVWLLHWARGATWQGVINCFALAAAFAAAILLASLVRYELAFNATLDPNGSVAEIVTRTSQPGRPPVTIAGTTGELAAALTAVFPDLRAGRMFHRPDPQQITIAGQTLFERVVEADPDMAGILTFNTKEGDVRSALGRPDGAVLTTRAATRIFGRENVMDEPFMLDGHVYRVATIIDAPSRNTRLADLDIMISGLGSWTTLGQANAPGGVELAFVIGAAKTFVVLDSGRGPSGPEILARADAIAAAAFGRMMAANPAIQADPPRISHHLAPLRNIDAASRAGLAPDPNRADAVMLATMSGLALLVVMVAVFNYVNLATSRASHRAAEIAVRKAFGASRVRLAAGLLWEGIAVSLTAAVLGLIMAAALENWFSSLVKRPLELALDPAFLASALAVALLTGVLAGFSPAVVISAFRPALVLGARGAESPGAGLLRTGLVTLQVAASVAAIALCWTVQMQLAYLTGSGLGFDDRDVIVYRLPVPLGSADERLRVILARFAEVAGPGSAAAAEAIPNEGQVGRLTVQGASAAPLDLTAAGVGHDYFSILGINILAGRSFDARETDGASSVGALGLNPVILTRKASVSLGFTSPEAALGAILAVSGSTPWQAQVIGVVEDHPLPRLRDPAPDAVYLPVVRSARYVAVRLSPGRAPGVEARLDDVMRSFFPDRPPDRFTLTTRVEAAHLDLSRLFGLVAFLAVLSAASALLGVVGMSAALARHLRRESAIRKAFGASAMSIAGLLIARLSPPVMLGMAIGGVVAWALSRRWLSGFPRQVELGLAPELAACALVAVLALAVSAWQTARLARARPSDILGYE